MATKQSTVDFILEQLRSLEGVRARKMFGEYALYYDEKVVALICDDRLFMKVTEPGTKFIPEAAGVPPYPNAKNYLPVTPEQLEDKQWLTDFVEQTAAVLPVKKK